MARGVDRTDAGGHVHFDARVMLAVAGLVVVFGLLVIAGRADYLAYHSVVEFVVAAVALAVFAISWHTRGLVEDDFLTILGVCFLFEAGVTILHALTYQGVGVFPSATATMGSQFWLVARATLVAGFVVAPAFIGRVLKRPSLAIVAFGVPVIIAVVAVFSGIFPVTFVTSVGLTAFKVGSEWVIVGAFVLGWWLLWRERERLEQRVFADVSVAIGCMIAAEITFTAYASLTDIFNVVGHILHLASFYFVYRALVARTLEDPFAVLLRRLAVRESELREENRYSEGLNRIVTAVNPLLGVDDILGRSVAGAVLVAEADGATVTLRDDDGRFRIRYAYGPGLQGAVGMVLDRANAPHVFEAAEAQVPVAVSDTRSDPRMGVLDERFGTRSLLTVPLVTGGETMGTLSLHWLGPSAHASSPRLVLFAKKLGSALSMALDNARLYEGEHRVAEALQTAMAVSVETAADVEIGSVYLSAPGTGRIGGDFFDVFDLADGTVAFLLGDVSGKGIEAAATNSLARSTLRALAYRNPAPEKVLAGASEALLRQLGDAEFVTVAFGVLDPETAEVAIGLAGHPDPIVCGRPDLVPRVLRDPPLAIASGETFSAWRFALEPGEAVVLFSDGICEARRDGEFFGIDRVRDLLHSCRDESCQAIADRVLREVELFSDGVLRDDIAVLALRPHAHS